MLKFIRLGDSILLELLLDPRELLLDRETDRLDIEDREDCEPLLELLRELCLPPELLDDDDLLLLLDAKTGSAKITAPSIIISTNFRLNPDSFMIKSRTTFKFNNIRLIAC